MSGGIICGNIVGRTNFSGGNAICQCTSLIENWRDFEKLDEFILLNLLKKTVNWKWLTLIDKNSLLVLLDWKCFIFQMPYYFSLCVSDVASLETLH